MTLAKLRVAAWLASCAMLAGSLAPAVTHLLGAFAPAAAPWAVLVRTKVSSAARRLTSSCPPSPAEGDGKFAAGHCPFCLPHAGSFALPYSPTVAILAAEPEHFLPTLFLQAPRPLHAWATAQPRAPPRSAS